MSVFAACFCFGAGAAEEPEAQERTAPQIVSKNISYSSYLYIFFAVPADTVEVGADIELRIYNSSSDVGGTPAYVVDDYELQTITSISGSPEKYYVFKTRGIAAKNMDKAVYAQPVAVASDGTELVGDTKSYSIAEYLYERLYKGGFIDMVEDDGKDYLRRNLYLALLEYGSAAQRVLIEDKLGISVRHVTDLDYFAIRGTTQFGFFTPGDKITVPLDSDVAVGKGYKFSGWEMLEYVDGVCRNLGTLEAGQSVTLSGGSLVIVPRLVVYDEILAQEGRDDVMIAQKWAELEVVAGKEITDALKTLYSLYGDDMADWSASLFAKGYIDYATNSWAGGYYASAGGRDNPGFGPDVQNTEQMFRFIQQSGMLDELGGNVANNLPDWVKYQVVYFVKSLQNEDNGYFYHPQWGKAATDAKLSRRSRDLGWATSLLSRFGSAPTYDTPNGKKGDGITADEYLLSLINSGLVSPSDVPKSFRDKYLTSSLGTSEAFAVSSIILTDVIIENEGSSDNTAHLESYTGFINYMLSTVIPGMNSNPYNMGNEISSMQSEISTASKKLVGTSDAPTPYRYTEGDEANTAGATAADYRQFDGMTLKEIAIKGLNSCINPEIGLWGKTSEKNPTGTEFLFTNGFMKAMAIYNDFGATYPYPVAAAKALMQGLMSDEKSTGNICEVYNIWTAIDRLQSNLKNNYDQAQVLEVIDGHIPTAEEVNAHINSEFAKNAPAAILNSYYKILGYKKVDGGFAHSYSSGTAAHQGLPVSNGANLSDVDATCIGSTGLTREIFAALGLSNYKIPIFTKSDWMRYLSILEGANPILKGTESEAKLDFSNAEFPSDLSVKYGSMTLVSNNGSNALRLDENKGGKLVIERSGVSTVGSVILFEADMTFLSEGEYTLEFFTNEGAAYSVRLTVSGGKLTVAAADALSVDYLAGDEVLLSIRLDISAETGAKADLMINGSHIGDLGASFGDSVSVTRLTDIKRAEFTQVTAGAVVFDNLVYMITDPHSKIDFESLDINTSGSGTLKLNGMNAVITEEQQSACTVVTTTENGNKYLHFTKTKGVSGVSGSQSYVHFNWGALATSKLVFESKIRINNTANKNYVKINLKSAASVSTWEMLVGNSTVRFYLNSSGEYLDVSYSDLGIRENEWFELKVVITTGGNGAFSAGVYFKGNLKMQIDSYYKGYCDASGIVSLGVIPDQGWLGTVDIDDMDVYSATDPIAEENMPLPENPTVRYECTEHNPLAEVIENKKAASCVSGESYDKVVYCHDCGKEISRETVISDVLGDHSVGTDNVCTVCGGQFFIRGELDFATFPEGEWTLNTGSSVIVDHFVQGGAVASTAIVSEDGEKFFRMYKEGCSSTGSNRQSWLIVQRTASVSEGEPLVVQMTMRHNQLSGSSTYLRFYRNRTAANGEDGTVYGSGAERNLLFNVQNGYVCFNGTSLGVKNNEWFTLRLVLVGQTVAAYVRDELGNFEYKATFTAGSTWGTSDLKDCTALVLMNDSTTFHKTDIKSAYFGAMPEYVSADELKNSVKAPSGACTFDEMDDGTLGYGTYTNNAIGYYIQGNAEASMSVVTDGDDKVLSINKSAYKAGSSAQTWMNVGIADGAGAVRVFETRMKIASWTKKGSGCYFRLYKGRNVASDGGTNISGNINILGDGGKVSVAGVDVGANVGEWFTLRIVMNSEGYEILALLDGNTEFISITKVTGIDLSECDVVTNMTTNENICELRFDYIYFGGEPSYVE